MQLGWCIQQKYINSSGKPGNKRIFGEICPNSKSHPSDSFGAVSNQHPRQVRDMPTVCPVLHITKADSFKQQMKKPTGTKTIALSITLTGLWL